MCQGNPKASFFLLLQKFISHDVPDVMDLASEYFSRFSILNMHLSFFNPNPTYLLWLTKKKKIHTCTQKMVSRKSVNLRHHRK